MRYKPYNKYKPSGVNWLGCVPAHWDLNRLKDIITLVDIKVKADEKRSVPYLGMENVESWTGQLSRLEHIVPTGSVNEFNAEHTLFGKLRPYLAKAYNPNCCGLCSTEFMVMKSIEIDRHLLLYLLLDKGFIRLVDSSTYGAKMPRTSWGFLGNCVVPVAPKIEQKTIVTFLEKEMKKIDKSIKKNQKLIERLMEYRTALISHFVAGRLPTNDAVQAGINPHPKLRQTSIEWLGSVPEHWQIVPIKFVANVASGHTPSRTETQYWTNCNIPWISLTDSKHLKENNYISDTVCHINELGLAHSSARLLPPRSVVFSRDATVGLCAVTTKKMAVSQHFIAYICGPRLLPEYLLISLEAMRQNLKKISMGSTIVTIGMDDILSLMCPLPPYIEQQSIVHAAWKKTKKLNELVVKIQAAIERLLEYRSALVSAVVTGKIDVRNE